jgi:hypothetical protein
MEITPSLSISLSLFFLILSVVLLLEISLDCSSLMRVKDVVLLVSDYGRKKELGNMIFVCGVIVYKNENGRDV